MLPVLGKKAVLEWCMKGLIGSSYACPNCGKSMELREKTALLFEASARRFVSLPAYLKQYMTSETVEVARIALWLPPFWKSNVRLWIAQCDHASQAFDKLAIIADKVSEVVGASSTICAATTVPPPSQSSSCSVQPTMDSPSRQADPRAVSTRVSVEEVASATIIVAIKRKQAWQSVSPCAEKTRAKSFLSAGMAESLSTYQPVIFIRPQKCKQALADAALLAHPSPSAPLALHVGASDYATGKCTSPSCGITSELQPLAFFSRKLTHLKKSLQFLRP
ncbi:hypothetical protein TNCV_2643941 [Trichonephila clavipes]|nr:hypothetical protein TNCV_2643941 [Trichonephila clavipes]